MPKAPCKDCLDRVIGCHASCAKYQAFRKKQDEVIENRRKFNQTEADCWGNTKRRNGWKC